MLKSSIVFILLSLPLFFVSHAHAQEMHQDVQGTWRAEVTEVVSSESKQIPGTDTYTDVQTIKALLLDGARAGEIVTLDNDYIQLKRGDVFFLNYLVTINGDELYVVRDIDRRFGVLIYVALFVTVIIGFGGKQGIRSLLSLIGSFFVILYVLVPSLLKGYPPVVMSVMFASIILFLAIYLTHGFNRESSVAFIGTVTAVIITGVLAHLGIIVGHLTGFASDEAIYLNFDTRGSLDIAGLLLGGIIIGVLGVLDDIAVTQAAVVSELYNSNPSLTRRQVYASALRVGKEHVGALVNTLALAYTGASLPLLLLFSTSEASVASIFNQEVFATEIIRTVVGSIGLVLTVPITTLLAVYVLKGYKSKHAHTHSHGHSHHHH